MPARRPQHQARNQPLYVDSSALLRRVLGHADADELDRIAADRVRSGAVLVSSRLLWLEARRVEVRERAAGQDISGPLAATLSGVNRLPVTEEVWAGAHALETHIKTLDSLHLATCHLIEANLLSTDIAMRTAAQTLGIEVLP